MKSLLYLCKMENKLKLERPTRTKGYRVSKSYNLVGAVYIMHNPRLSFVRMKRCYNLLYYLYWYEIL